MSIDEPEDHVIPDEDEEPLHVDAQHLELSNQVRVKLCSLLNLIEDFIHQLKMF